MLAYRTNPKMPPKPMHVADATDRAKIATAVSFVTTLFLGRGQFDRHPSNSLLRARQVAQQMLDEPDYARGRVPMIYAVLPDGSEVLVPDDYPTDAWKATAVATGRPAYVDDQQHAPLSPPAQPAFDALSVFPGLKKLSARHLDLLEAAQAGALPTPPDSSKPSWEGNVYRGRLAKLVAMVEAGDVAGLEAEKLPTYDSGFVAMARYRNLAVIALKARAARRGQP